jgi:hypothetical protein
MIPPFEAHHPHFLHQSKEFYGFHWLSKAHFDVFAFWVSWIGYTSSAFEQAQFI